MPDNQPPQQRYAVIESSTGNIINIVLWDGVSQWSPGDGYTVRLATDPDQIAESPQVTPIFAGSEYPFGEAAS